MMFGGSGHGGPKLPPKFKSDIVKAKTGSSPAAAEGSSPAPAPAAAASSSPARSSAAAAPAPGKAARVVQAAELSAEARDALTTLLFEKAAGAGGDSEGADLWAAGVDVVKRDGKRFTCLIPGCGGSGVNDGVTGSGGHSAYTHVIARHLDFAP